MSRKVKRFEVRCSPLFERLVRAVCRYEGDATSSALFRRIVLSRAQTLRVTSIADQKHPLLRVLDEIEAKGVDG